MQKLISIPARRASVLEIVVLITMIYAFAAVVWARGLWVRHRDRVRDKWVSRALNEIAGKPVALAMRQFGSPFEVIEGSERSFYVWKSPPSQQFPQGSGLLIVNLIADHKGQVLQSSWLTR